MQLRTKCPGCQKVLRCPSERMGTMVRCPACRHKFRLESLASGSEASIDAQPSMEAMQTIEQPPPAGRADGLVASRQPCGSRGSNDSQASRSVSQGGRRRAAVASLPSLGRFGNYNLKEVLGKGGFGVVYRAWDESLGRQVAIKIPRFDLGAERKVKRFQQEARAAAKLQHPNIVGIIAEGVENRRPYIVAEFVDGQPLSKAIDQTRPTHRQAAQWVRDLAGALHYAHQQGIVHRDIKPDNVMLDQDQRPRLMDFGLAKQLDEDSSLSVDGSVLGTPNYMAPEQARGEIGKVDGRSDQYSLGVVLYELLTGEKPFSGPPHAVLGKVADPNFEPPTLRSRDATIAKDLEAICQRAMAKDATNRYVDMQALADDLDRWLEGKPTDARPLGPHERAARWCRRNPALAGSGAALSLGLLVIMGLVWKLATADTSPVIVQSELAVTSDPTSDASLNPIRVRESSNTSEPTASLTAPVPAAPPVAPAPPAPPWQPTLEQQAFMDAVAMLPFEEQAVAVAKKLQEVNPGFDGEFQYQVEDETIIEYKFLTHSVSKIWPVRALRDLTRLEVPGVYPDRIGKLEDLSSLSGMRLRHLSVSATSVSDLSPLAGMPLTFFHCSFTPVSDLSPLSGMGLRFLNVALTNVSNLTPVTGMPIRDLSCQHTNVSDLSPLTGAPLQSLWAYGTLVADLRPILGSPLEDLRVKQLAFFTQEEELIKDLTPKHLGTSYDDKKSSSEFFSELSERRSAAEGFVAEIGSLPIEEQISSIEKKLHEINHSDEIEFSVNRNEGVIVSAAVRLNGSGDDISPLRGLATLKKLTVNSGVRYLDLSPLNNLQIEELNCRKEQAMRNRLMLAEIATLKKINGQPADQYLASLKSLSEPQADQTPAAMPTEEELLAAHPPLDEWLEGREILTVAQDGSAMFTTIQAALDAQKSGQVVEVLDKGPYSERLHWNEKDDCGLISRVGTAVRCASWADPASTTTTSGNRWSHNLTKLVDCRLHGFVFITDATERKQQYSIGSGQITGLCLENCVFGVNPAGEKPDYDAIQLQTYKWGALRPIALCIRDNVFHSMLAINNAVDASTVIVKNNFFVFRGGIRDNSKSSMVISPNGEHAARMELRSNVFLNDASGYSEFTILGISEIARVS